jgi:hypothetical protein
MWTGLLNDTWSSPVTMKKTPSSWMLRQQDLRQCQQKPEHKHKLEQEHTHTLAHTYTHKHREAAAVESPMRRRFLPWRRLTNRKKDENEYKEDVYKGRA